jgi:hypothetical protein
LLLFSLFNAAGNSFAMTHDEDGKKDAAAQQEKLPTDVTKRKSESAAGQWGNLERRVLGAVRQAVTDAMQEDRKSVELPPIDMDFVATPSASTAGGGIAEPDKSTASTRPDIVGIEQAEVSRSSSSGLPRIAIACSFIGLVLIGVTAIFVVNGNEQESRVAIRADAHGRLRLITDGHQLSDAGKGASAGEIARRSTIAVGQQPANDARESEVTAQREAEQRVRTEAETERLRRLDILQAAVDKARQTAMERERELVNKVNRLRLADLRVATDKVRRVWRRNEARRKAQRKAREAAESAKHRRLATLRAAVDEARQTAMERERELARQVSRLRLVGLRMAMNRVRESWRRQKAQRQRGELLAVRPSGLSGPGSRDPRGIEAPAMVSKGRARSESVLIDRLAAVLKEAESLRLQIDRVHSKASTVPTKLPSSRAAKEKIRLKLEQVLVDINAIKPIAGPPYLLAGPTPARSLIRLRLKGRKLEVAGELLTYDGMEFVMRLRPNRQVKLPAEYFDCISPGCPN